MSFTVSRVLLASQEMSERMSVLLNKKPCYDIVFTKGFGGLPEELAALECGARTPYLSVSNTLPHKPSPRMYYVFSGISKESLKISWKSPDMSTLAGVMMKI